MRVGQQSSWLVARLVVVRVGGARPRDRKPPAYCGPPHVVERRWARIGYGRLPLCAKNLANGWASAAWGNHRSQASQMARSPATRGLDKGANPWESESAFS